MKQFRIIANTDDWFEDSNTALEQDVKNLFDTFKLAFACDSYESEISEGWAYATFQIQCGDERLGSIVEVIEGWTSLQVDMVGDVNGDNLRDIFAK